MRWRSIALKKTTAFFLTVAVAGSALTAFAQTPPSQAQTTPGQPAAGRGGRGAPPPMPPGPNPNSQYRLGPDSMPQEGVPKGEIRGPYHAAQQGLSRHPAHLLGVRAGAVRSGRAGQPDGLPGRAGVQGREWRSADAERDGQPDLPARDPGDDRSVHQSGPPARPARTQPADRLGRRHHQSRHRVQHARRQVRPRDHRRADAGAL